MAPLNQNMAVPLAVVTTLAGCNTIPGFVAPLFAGPRIVSALVTVTPGTGAPQGVVTVAFMGSTPGLLKLRGPVVATVRV